MVTLSAAPCSESAVVNPTRTGRAKQKWRWALAAAPALLCLFSNLGTATAAEDAAADQPVTAPHYIGLAAWEERPTFTAGDSGVVSVSLYLAETKDPHGNTVRWDPNGDTSVLRVSARAGSGLRFEGGQTANEGVVTFDVKNPRDGVVTVDIPYSVASRVRARNYELRLDVSAPLVSTNGAHIRDSGLLSDQARVDTPLRTKLIVIAVLLIAVFLFIVEWVRVDVVAIMMMISMPMLNLLGSRQTFTGLSSNAVVAIIGVMIVSAGLNRVGLVSRAVKPVIRSAGTSSTRLMVSLSSLIAVISSVMQNTGAAVLFLPGIRHACKVMRIPISKILMPIGMCAILGGTLTMIGTSPLILLNDILPEGVDKFGLLELTPIGLGFVICGIIYFSTIGRHLLTKAMAAQQQEAGDSADEADVRSLYHEVDGPFELRVPSQWTMPKGLPDTIVEIRREWHANIVCLADRAGLHDVAPPPDSRISAGLNLCAYGPRAEIEKFAAAYDIRLLDQPVRFTELFNSAVAGTVEAVMSPRSQLIGSTIKEVSFRRTFGVTVLALYRKGSTYYKEMSDIPLMPGDALLLHATWEHFHTLQTAHHNFQIITPLEVEIQQPRKSTTAVICFAITLGLMLLSSFYFQKQPYNPIPLSVCLMTGAFLMVVTRVLDIREAYTAVDWRTVFLLSGLIPLGMAVDRTGTAEWIATGVVAGLGDSITPFIFILVLAILSSAFCLVISNVGACTLLVPLGASMAVQIGVDPRVAAIVVGLGVSNSFLLPTHQVNALYMGPGGYRVKDYIKIGGMMSVIYIAVLVSMTYLFYL